MSGVPLLRSALLAAVPGIDHGFATREGGVSGGPYASLNLGASAGDDPASIRANRRRFAAAFARPLDALVIGEQRHGSDVAVAGEGPMLAAGGRGQAGVDAVITDARGPLLMVLSADCVPILMAAADGRAVAAVHAGWRGAAEGVVANAVRGLWEAYGVAASELVVAIGPAIEGGCYEVDRPVIEAFGAGHPALAPGRPGRAMLDLAGAAAAQLVEAGVAPERTEALPYCTACRADLFFSYRRDGDPTGRTGAAIGLR